MNPEIRMHSGPSAPAWPLRTVQPLRAALLIAAVVCVVAGSSPAQPVLNFSDIVVNWPEVKLQFSVKCDGHWTDTFLKQNFRVFEDSIEVGEFQLSCPERRAHCPIRAVLVLDASGSMLGSKNEHTIAAAKEFVNQMDGIDDQAAVIWFHSKDTLVQTMTSDRDSLRAAIDALPAAGTTAAWDAAYDGISELIRATLPTDSCRAVILLTDGIDNSSTRSVNDVISYALANGVRVYTVELGDEGDAGALQILASSTGGRYFQVRDFGHLTDIYQDIFMNLVGIDRCEIIYRSTCGDGTVRHVTLQLLNFCGGSDTKYRTYLPPAQGFPGVPATVEVGSVQAKEDSTALLPIRLKTPIGDTTFPPATVLIRYDTNCVTFVGVECRDSCLLHDVAITATTQGDAIFVTLTRKVLLPGTGTLFFLRFHTRPLLQSRCCDVRIDEWKTTGGCIAFTFAAGEICVVAKEPLVTCAVSAPDSLRWDASLKRYAPDTMRIRAIFSNAGQRIAVEPVYTLTCDSTAVDWMAPPTYTIIGDSAGIPAGSAVEVTWLVRPTRAAADRVLHFCVRAAFYNHAPVTCCRDVRVGAAEAALVCSVNAPQLKADSVRFRYVPDPLECAVTVVNVGGKTSDSIFVTLVLPDGIRLSPRESTTDLTRALQPSVLRASEGGVARWLLSPVITTVRRDLDVMVIVRTRAGDSSTCVLRIVVPPLNAAILRTECTVPAVLAADSTALSFSPNPFDVTLAVTNEGNRPARDVDALLILPPGTEFVPASDTPLKRFAPAVMLPYRPGDPRPTLAWRVRFTRHATAPDLLVFKWLVTYRNHTAPDRDTVLSYCLTRVEPLPARLECQLTMPDTLRANADRTAIEPDPFTVTYRVRNISRMSVTIDRIAATLQGLGALFLPETPPVVDIFRALAPGDSVSVSWRVIAEARTSSRALSVTASALDDQGNAATCGAGVWLQGIPAVITCAMHASPDTVFYDRMAGRYLPDILTVNAQVTNNSAVPLNDLAAALRWTTPLVPDPLSFDTSVAGSGDRQTVPLCFPGQTKSFDWLLHLDRTVPVAQYETISFVISHGAAGIPETPAGCETSLVLAPDTGGGGAPEIACSLKSIDTVRFIGTDYDPATVTVLVRVENPGTEEATGIRIFALQDARFQAVGPTTLVLPRLGAGEYAGPDSLAFVFTVLPRSQDRIDTVRVAVLADGLPARICEWPIFIEGERSPSVSLACSSPVDTVGVDRASGTFIPDPLAVTVRLENRGETDASDCVLQLAGTGAFSPADSTTFTVGTLRPGEVRDAVIRLHPIQRSVTVQDTLAFLASFRGGYHARLQSADCRVPVTVLENSGPFYTLSCAAPDSLAVGPGRGYIPDPFPFRVVLRNIGSARGTTIAVRVTPPAGVTLASGQSSVILLSELAAGDSTVVRWMLRADRRSTDTVLSLCAEAADAKNRPADCCSALRVPGIPAVVFDVSCTAPDSLRWNVAAGGYDGIPFPVCARVRNPGNAALDSVTVLLTVGSGTVTADSVARIVIPRLLPGDAADVCWNARVRTPPKDETVPILFTVAAGSDTARCERRIFIEAPPPPRLVCALATEPPDTLHYNPAKGEYEGTPSAHGPYTVFTLTVRVRNDGAATASGLLAMLDLPAGIVPEQGETAALPLVPRDLQPGAEGRATWTLRALRDPAGSLQTLSVAVYSDQGAGAACEARLFVDAAPHYALATIPANLTARFGETIVVPVFLDSVAEKNIRSFRIQVAYDSSMLAFLDARYAGADALIGWDGPDAAVIGDDAASRTPVVRIAGSAPDPLRSDGTLPLLQMRFRVGDNPGGSPLTIVQLPLLFRPAVRSGGRRSVGALNAPDDSSQGDVLLRYGDGMLTVTGDCVLPLRDRGGARIVGNIPNPFNPATTVVYELPDAATVRVRVFDSFGRPVRTLFEGPREAGTHRIVFEAGNLPAGVYTCVLETQGVRRTRPMLLLK